VKLRISSIIGLVLIGLKLLGILPLDWLYVAIIAMLPTGVCMLIGLSVQTYREELRDVKRDALRDPHNVNGNILFYEGRYTTGRQD
jgi:hypothetical protein